MTHEYNLVKIEDPSNHNFGNILINTPDGAFVRRLDQHNIPKSHKIAEDDGTPMDRINMEDFLEKVETDKCLGTYTYSVETIDGGEARVAVTK